MPVRRFRAPRKIMAGAVAVSCGLSAHTATAQQALEEVIVTAQKRVESLQDVPISITAVSGQKMDDAGIFKIEDLQTFTPNLSMTETGISTQIYIRGIGTGNNRALSSPSASISTAFTTAASSCCGRLSWTWSGWRSCAAHRVSCSARIPWRAP